MEIVDSNQAKRAVSEAFETFGKTRRLSEANEAETRCELIDRILAAVGWESGSFCREVKTGTGDYVDYELPRSTSHPTLVIEAKRSGATFVVEDAAHDPGRTRSLQRLFNIGGKTLKEALKQAAGYCNDRAIPYACVTNGYQWLFFRGLSSESQKWLEGRVIVFPSPELLIANFDEFLGCLAPHKVASSELPRLLARPTPRELPRSIVPLEHLTLRRKSASADLLDLRRRIGQQFFTRIHGNDRPQMLGKCYVEPGGRPEFDRSLQRLLEDTLSSEMIGEDVYQGNTEDFVSQLQTLEASGTVSSPILIVGNVGVGKTTFLYRTLASLREVSDEASAKEKEENFKTKDDVAISAYVDLENQGNLEVFDDQEVQRQTAIIVLDKLSQSAISTLKKRDDITNNARIEADPYNEITLRSMLRHRLKQERSSSASYYERNPEKWEEREEEIKQDYRKDAVNFLIGYVRHLRRFKRRDELQYPVLLVLDNLDQASSQYQRCIYGLALRLAKETQAVTIVSIREDTFSEGRQPRGFLSSSPLEFVFHVQAPALDQLLRQRIKYIRYCIKHDSLPKGLRNATDEISKVVETLTKGLLDTPCNGLEVVSALSGHNIRSALRIVREFVSGTALVASTPEPTVEFLLEALIAIAGQLDHQLDLKKLFDADPQMPPLHALRLRLLGYYSWVYGEHPHRSLLEHTESVIAKFSAWGYPSMSVEQALHSLYSQELLVSVKQEASYALPPRMSISPVGYAHSTRLAFQKVFRTVMALVSRWYDQDLAKEFIQQATIAGTEEGTSLADIVAADAVEVFEAYLKTAMMREDKLLSEKVSVQRWVQETLSRSNMRDANPLPRNVPKKENVHPGNSEIEQLSLGLTLNSSDLPRLPRDRKLHQSVWLTRILWALEYAAINHLGPRTAAEIGRILTENGDISVPAPNVARAFRGFKGKPEIEAYFAHQGQRYSITEAGSIIIRNIIQSEYRDDHEEREQDS